MVRTRPTGIFVWHLLCNSFKCVRMTYLYERKRSYPRNETFSSFLPSLVVKSLNTTLLILLEPDKLVHKMDIGKHFFCVFTCLQQCYNLVWNVLLASCYVAYHPAIPLLTFFQLLIMNMNYIPSEALALFLFEDKVNWLFDVIRYETIWYYTKPDGTIWHDTIRQDSIRFDTIRYDTKRYDTNVTKRYGNAMLNLCCNINYES